MTGSGDAPQCPECFGDAGGSERGCRSCMMYNAGLAAGRAEVQNIVDAMRQEAEHKLRVYSNLVVAHVDLKDELAALRKRIDEAPTVHSGNVVPWGVPMTELTEDTPTVYYKLIPLEPSAAVSPCWSA